MLFSNNKHEGMEFEIELHCPRRYKRLVLAAVFSFGGY